MHGKLEVDEDRLRLIDSGEEWIAVWLEVGSLAEIRGRARELIAATRGRLELSEVVGEAQALH